MALAFGLLTDPSNDILDEIKTIEKMGLDYVELGIEAPEGSPEVLSKKKGKIMKAVAGFRENAIGHTSPWIDLGSSYEDVRKGWILESKKILDVAKNLKLPLVNFHANTNGLFIGSKRRMLLDNWIDSLRKLVSYARKHNTELMLENMPQGRSIHSLDEYQYVVNRVPNLLVHLDIPHAFTSGGMKAVLDYIETFSDRIAHVHWHDNNGQYDEHLPIGEGQIDHEVVVKTLKKIGYERTITLEVFTSKSDAVKSLTKLKQMWRDL